MSAAPLPGPDAPADRSFGRLRELLHRTSGCQSLADLLEVVADELPSLLAARDRVSIVFTEPDERSMRIYRLLPRWETVPSELPRVRMDGTPVGEVVRKGAPRVVADVREDRNVTFGHASHDGIRSTVSVPVHRAGRVVGAMNIGSTTPGACTDAMVPTLRDVAAIVAPALLALERTPSPAARPDDTGGLVGESDAFQKLLVTARRAAESGANILVTGETGTGKTALARAIHEWSARRRGAFVTVHIGALSTTLVEAELFGHERGAFTGALARRAGRFEMAHRGTLFIDEVADTPPAVQAKLLRVIQDGTFERVGGSETLRSDARIIAATHRDLHDAVARGQFREDLLYRLDVVALVVPPLRARGDDVALVAKQTLARLGEQQQRPLRLSDAAWRRVRAHAWPGNIRELESALQRAAALEDGDVLELEGLGRSAGAAPAAWPSLVEHERRYVERVLVHTEGVIEGPHGAAQLLDLRPSTLRSRMKRLGIDPATGRPRGDAS